MFLAGFNYEMSADAWHAMQRIILFRNESLLLVNVRDALAVPSVGEMAFLATIGEADRPEDSDASAAGGTNAGIDDPHGTLCP